MKNHVTVSKIIKPFNKSLKMEGDKSLSIRWALLASQASGKSSSYNLLKSEDVLNTLQSLKKLGIKIKHFKNKCVIISKGLNKFNYKKKIFLNAGNSGTLGRLILGLLVHSKNKIVIKGDKSLSKRDFSRVTKPLKNFGANFKTNNGKLPITIFGTNTPKAIKYLENKGSAQCKSSVMLAALNTQGTTIIRAKKSRNHTELLFKHLKLPINIKRNKKFDFIKIKGGNVIKPLNYRIPSDISSSAFFIVLTALSENSKIRINRVNINPTRTGILKILKMMGVQIKIKNSKIYKGEKIADLFVASKKSFKSINCPVKLNSSAIDEFLLIFLLAAKAKGVSYFKKLSELNQKESPRLIWGSKILNKMGIKTVLTKDSIKIYGNPNLKINKEIVINKFLKDHRIFMTSMVAALTFGGKWKIFDKSSINTSFPSFLSKIKSLGAKFS
ncbi:3-phosphoshikimate 1-carboxyvinyltransferase [Candidatus Pelagibacter sp.]|nr:3-phosphoshikimate 1-carboxyvinyltransferase [Candidatus Pelagibacter sp.]